MEMRFEKFDNILVAHLQCYLDHSGAENFKYVLFERMKENMTVVLDLEKLVNIDSFGLDALLAAAQKACEMHSMSMEFLTHPWMEHFFKEDTSKYLYSFYLGKLIEIK